MAQSSDRAYVDDDRTQHGFNKQTPGLFWADLLKSLALGAVLGGPIIAIVVGLINWGGPYFYLYVWGALFGTHATHVLSISRARRR